MIMTPHTESGFHLSVAANGLLLVYFNISGLPLTVHELMRLKRPEVNLTVADKF
jgi:hypothetical protein